MGITKGVQMKKLFMLFTLVLVLCFVYGCLDKEAMTELEALKAQADPYWGH